MDEGMEEEKEEEDEEEEVVCAMYTRPGKPYSRVVFTARKRRDSARDPREASRLHLPVPSLYASSRLLICCRCRAKSGPSTRRASANREMTSSSSYGDILARANGLTVDFPEQNADIPAFSESLPRP